MEEKNVHYYVRDLFNRPYIAIALYGTKENIARGIALCHDKDFPNKKVGRSIAITRAKNAFEKRITTDPLKPHLDKKYDLFRAGINPHFIYKLQYSPKLSDYEKELVNKVWK